MNKVPLVSMLVHTRNSERTIKEHLESIKRQSYRNKEVIVVDNNSTDDTLKIVKKYGYPIYTHGPERSAQRNFAAKKAKGEFFLVPDSDMILDKNVIKDCVELVLANPKFKAIVIPEKSFGEGFWARCKALERSFYIGLSWMEGARFFTRKIFEEMGGYDEDNTGTEDFDLPQRIKKKHGEESTGRINSYIFHDEGRLSLRKTVLKKFYYAQNLETYKKKNLAYYVKQSNLVLRLVLFFSQPIKLFKNPLLGIGLLFMKTSEFFAGGLGYLFRKKIDIYGNQKTV